MTDDPIKHLEFIQSVIGRLSTNAFLIKGWALTVTAAFFGFSVRDVDARLALVGLVPLMAFWGLDAYFLSRERMYRSLYDAVRTGSPHVDSFAMDYKRFATGSETGWLRCARSSTVAGFYSPILAAGIVVVIASASHL